MEAEILVRNLQEKIRFNRGYIRGVVKKTIQCSGIDFSPVEVSVIIVDNRRIRQVNRKYRRVNRVTDVIAFPSVPGFPGKAGGECYKKNKIYGGDVFVSIERARSQAREFNHSLRMEMALLTAHGVLHLFGYDHIKKKDAVVMRKKEEELLNCLNRRKTD